MCNTFVRFLERLGRESGSVSFPRDRKTSASRARDAYFTPSRYAVAVANRRYEETDKSLLCAQRCRCRSFTSRQAGARLLRVAHPFYSAPLLLPRDTTTKETCSSRLVTLLLTFCQMALRIWRARARLAQFYTHLLGEIYSNFRREKSRSYLYDRLPVDS